MKSRECSAAILHASWRRAGAGAGVEATQRALGGTGIGVGAVWTERRRGGRERARGAAILSVRQSCCVGRGGVEAWRQRRGRGRDDGESAATNGTEDGTTDDGHLALRVGVGAVAVASPTGRGHSLDTETA